MARLTTAARCLGLVLSALLLPPTTPVARAQVGASVPLVVDSHGQVIGTPVDLFPGPEIGDAGVLFDAPGGPVVLNVDHDRIGTVAVVVRFSLPDCGGQAYLDPWFTQDLTRRVAAVGPVSTLYISTSRDQVNFASRSSITRDGPCTNEDVGGPPVQGYPAISTGINLAEMFTPPFSIEFRTVSTGPDLTVSALATTPSSPISTTPTTIKVTTKNIGAETVGASTTRLYLSVDAAVGPEDEILAEFSVAALPPNGSRTHSVSVLLPHGPRYLIAVADVEDQRAESKETNNTKKVLKNVM